MSKLKFALDTPTGRDLDRVVRFSGWCLDENGRAADQLRLRVDGIDTVSLERTPRWDLAPAFPDFPEAVLGGFNGDLPLPERAAKGERLDIELIARHGQDETILARERYRVAENAQAPSRRPRSYELSSVLEAMPSAIAAAAPGRWPAYILGTPHFHDPGQVPSIRVLEPGPTPPYSDGARAVIDGVAPAGLYLDLGCGIRRQEEIRENGIYLDAVHFRGVDIVNSRARLPLRDASVDAVVSLAVFEHLPDPFAMAVELHRVLKPGGAVWIETAFLQPLHADPGHYFNMTLEGLRRVFARFAIDAGGVLPHQHPSFALRMQIEHVLPYMPDGEWKRALQEFIDRVRVGGAALDAALGPIGRRTLAAGVYIRGRKDQSN
jgi:SAM-dependent methyltransferase